MAPVKMLHYQNNSYRRKQRHGSKFFNAVGAVVSAIRHRITDKYKLLVLSGLATIIALQLTIVFQQYKQAQIIEQQHQQSTGVTATAKSVRKTSTKDGDDDDVYPYYRPLPVSTDPNAFDGVKARAFKSLPIKGAVDLCLPAEHRWNYSFAQAQATPVGLLYMSLYKTGSTTAAGVNLRLGRVLAREASFYKKQINNNEQPEVDESSTGSVAINSNTSVANNVTDMCLTRYRHHHAFRMVKSPRDKQHSLLWTTVRDPTRRVVSQYFYGLSEKWQKPSDQNFKYYLQNNSALQEVDEIYNHYVGKLALQPFGMQRFENIYADERQAINEIFNEYDFIGVMERMDESLVVLATLLNVPVTHVLYLKANKSQGEFSKAARGPGCNYLPPSFVTKGMREFFKQDYWQSRIYWDYIFYKAANRSLDLTIEALGSKFTDNMAKYRQAQARTRELCTSRVQFPCTEGGVYHRNTDCMFLDTGCGNDCIDEVAVELLKQWNR